MITNILLVVNILLLVGVVGVSAVQLYRDRTNRARLRFIGIVAALWFLGVYLHEIAVGTRLSPEYVRPGLTLLLAYIFAERLYEYYAR